MSEEQSKNESMVSEQQHSEAEAAAAGDVVAIPSAVQEVQTKVRWLGVLAH